MSQSTSRQRAGFRHAQARSGQFLSIVSGPSRRRGHGGQLPGVLPPGPGLQNLRRSGNT